jgi:hypothetical protein
MSFLLHRSGSEGGGTELNRSLLPLSKGRAGSANTFPQESSTPNVGRASLPVCRSETAWEDRRTRCRARSANTFPQESSTPNVGRASLPVCRIETAWEDRPTRRRTRSANMFTQESHTPNVGLRRPGKTVLVRL